VEISGARTLREAEPNWDALIRECFRHPKDEAALGGFFEALLPYLTAALLGTYTGDREIVRDALQSAFLKYINIFRRKGENRDLAIGYFVVVAKNSLIDELRRRKGEIPIDEVAETELPFVQAVGEDDREARMMLLQYAMLQLDPRCQFVLESYYIDEMGAAKLAERLSVAPDSVHMVIKRCRDRLRQILAEPRFGLSEATKAGSSSSSAR
jgi:RNA polymerase sigma factor (sigma-70 family)